MRPRSLAALLALTALAAACGDASETGGPTPDPASRMQAILASSDLAAGAPTRVAVGLVLGDGRLVTSGTVAFRFSYAGTASAPLDPVEPGPEATATYLPTPGTPAGDGAPAPTQPSEARGVYEARDVTFERAGYWILEVTADLPDGPQRATTTIAVDTEPRLPAPGQPALATENPILRADGTPTGDVALAAIDSRAATGGAIPDPELHATTIAEALADGRPMLVLFATPVYCMSQFCGPVVDTLAAIAADWPGDAAFIHVEIWSDYQQQAIGEAAADWLYRNGDLTEPWLYLIDGDGVIVDRWTPLFDPEEVLAALAEVDPAA